MRIYKTKMWWFQLRPISRISKKPREIVRRKKGLPQRGLPRGSLYCKQTACIEKLGGEKGCQRCTCATSFHHHHQVLCLPIWKFFVNPSGPRKPPRRGTCHEASTREKIFKRPPLLFTLHRTTSQRLYDFPRIYLWIARCLCIHIYSRFENWRLFFFVSTDISREGFWNSMGSNATCRASIIYTLRCNFYKGMVGGGNLIDLYRYDFTLKNWLRCIRYVFNIPQYAIDECIIGLMFTSTCINITYINIASIYAVHCYPRNKL